MPGGLGNRPFSLRFSLKQSSITWNFHRSVEAPGKDAGTYFTFGECPHRSLQERKQRSRLDFVSTQLIEMVDEMLARQGESRSEDALWWRNEAASQAPGPQLPRGVFRAVAVA